VTTNSRNNENKSAGIYLAGAAIVACLLIAAGMWFTGRSLDATAENMIRLPVPTSRQAYLGRSKIYTIFQEFPKKTTQFDIVPLEQLDLEVRPLAAEAPLPLRAVPPELHYMLGARKVFSLGEFSVDTAGDYSLQVKIKDGAAVAAQCVIVIAPDLPGKYILNVAIGAVITILGVALGAAVVLILLARKRRAWLREH
jgi:hypothetical protein